MLLQGKRVIVTGGVTGIGRATVLAMAREGAAVVSVSRAVPTSERATKVIEAAKKLGPGPVAHMQIDVTKQADVDKVFDAAAKFLGGLDAIVNSAGSEQQKPTEDLVEQDLYEQFAVHVLGTAFTNSAACRHMKARGGSIINYASYAGVGAMPMMAAYGAAKGGVIAYTRVIAKEWAPYLIRANVICPGVITEMAETWYKEMSPERLAEITAWKKATIPLTGDFGKPEDAANLNVFLASDMSSYMTGQLLGVDGGMMMGR
jgi:3-oxoacyl-[acyl-carrier protein] reductase